MYLIDTDVSIDYMRGYPRIVKLLDSLNDVRLTTITVAELFFGAYSLNSSRVTASLKNYLQKFDYLPFNIWDSVMFGKIKADLKKRGTLVDDADIMIAAVARSYEFALITRNVKDFKKIKGLKVLEA